MATIHCKACGAIYRYEKEGCCPNCGAYNRPPKRERITADGTVQHMTDAAFEKRQHQTRDKVCFEKKECYEKKESHTQKVCYEDQARQGNRSTTYKRSDTAVYAKPQQPANNNQYAAPRPTGTVPHSQFPQSSGTSTRSSSTENKKKSLPIGCLIPFVFVAYYVLSRIFALIREVIYSIGG